MEKIQINEELKVSKLIFGTDKLITIWSRKERENLLRMSVDLGITHFDSAPLYGFRQSEKNLKKILRDFPDLTVTSKLGLYPPGNSNQSNFEVLVRKSGGRFFPDLKRPIVDFSTKIGKKSLEITLANLGRDHLELVLLHDPQIARLDSEEWYTFLLSARDRGMVGSFGVDGSAPHLSKLIEKYPHLCEIIQCCDDLHYTAEEFCERLKKTPKITFGYMTDVNTLQVNKEPLEAFSEGSSRWKNSAIIGSATSKTHLVELCRILDENQSK